jgi:hypothetical protein
MIQCIKRQKAIPNTSTYFHKSFQKKPDNFLIETIGIVFIKLIIPHLEQPETLFSYYLHTFHTLLNELRC